MATYATCCHSLIIFLIHCHMFVYVCRHCMFFLFALRMMLHFARSLQRLPPYHINSEFTASASLIPMRGRRWCVLKLASCPSKRRLRILSQRPLIQKMIKHEEHQTAINSSRSGGSSLVVSTVNADCAFEQELFRWCCPYLSVTLTSPELLRPRRQSRIIQLGTWGHLRLQRAELPGRLESVLLVRGFAAHVRLGDAGGWALRFWSDSLRWK